MLESVKRDLGELTTIVTTETSNIVINTTNVVKETLQVIVLIIVYCSQYLRVKYLNNVRVSAGKPRIYCQHNEEICEFIS